MKKRKVSKRDIATKEMLNIIYEHRHTVGLTCVIKQIDNRGKIFKCKPNKGLEFGTTFTMFERDWIDPKQERRTKWTKE